MSCYPILDIDGEEKILQSILNNEAELYEYTEVAENISLEYEKCVEEHNKGVINDQQSIVVAFDNQVEYKLCALYHAKMKRSRLILLKSISDIYEFINRGSYLNYSIFCDSNEISIEVITRLLALQLESSREFYFSFLTARNVASLNNLIIKNDIYKKYDITDSVDIVRTDYLQEDVYYDGEVKIIPRKHTTIESLKEAIYEKPVTLTTFIGHGRDELLWLNDGGICGRIHCDINNKTKKANMPACYYSNDCFWTGLNKVFAYDVLSRHAFINSCYSSKIENSTFGNDYNLCYSFLNGHAASYLGSAFLVKEDESTNFYYQAQVLSGITLGKAAANLNKYYYESRSGHKGTYFLVGDPLTRVEPKREIVHIELEDFDKWNVNGTYETRFPIESDTYLIIIRIPIHNFIKDYYNFRNRIMVYSVDKQNLFGVVLQKENYAELHVFSKTVIKKTEILINILQGNELNLEAVNNLSIIKNIDLINDKKFKHDLNELERSSINFSKLNFNKINNLNSAYKNMYKKLDGIQEKVGGLQKQVIDYLIREVDREGFLWDEYLLEAGLVLENDYKSNADVLCNYCGGKTFSQKYSHSIFKNIERKHTVCFKCGLIKESPANKEEIEVYFEGDSYAKVNNQFTQKIVIKNKTKHMQTGYAGMAFAWGYNNNIEMDKSSQFVKVKSNEITEITVNFSIPKDIPLHNYWLRGNIALNGDIFSIKKDIRIEN